MVESLCSGRPIHQPEGSLCWGQLGCSLWSICVHWGRAGLWEGPIRPLVPSPLVSLLLQALSHWRPSFCPPFLPDLRHPAHWTSLPHLSFEFFTFLSQDKGNADSSKHKEVCLGSGCGCRSCINPHQGGHEVGLPGKQQREAGSALFRAPAALWTLSRTSTDRCEPCSQRPPVPEAEEAPAKQKTE